MPDDFFSQYDLTQLHPGEFSSPFSSLIKGVIVREVNRKKRVAWCRGKRNWTVDSHWRKYIYTEECQIVIESNNCIDVWRRGAEVNRDARRFFFTIRFNPTSSRGIFVSLFVVDFLLFQLTDISVNC
jgi:hypothetical protein